jgi:hypothetical protein
MFTLEIGGRPVAVIAADEDVARRFLEGERFKRDMTRWLIDGRPVWDGRAPFRTRPASKAEIAAFKPEHSHLEADEEGPTVMFLGGAYDPDDFTHDE